MILYRNTKVKVRSPDGDTEYFDIVAGVLQGDTLAPYLFIICLDYVLRTSIDKIRENGFELTKRRSKRYPAKTITDADYADDLALLANTPNQAETLLHSLERAAAGIGLHVNANKTEHMCYNQTGNIATLDGASLKLVDKFTYLGSSVSSTEKDIDTRLTKAWTAIDRLSIIWKSDLTDKMKRSFFQAAVVSILLYGCTTWTLTKRLERRLDGNYTRMLRAVLNKSWRQHPTRLQLYGHLPPITKTIQVRRTRYIYTHTHNYTHIYAHTYICIYTHTCINTLTHLCIYTYIYIYIYTHTHTHIYIIYVVQFCFLVKKKNQVSSLYRCMISLRNKNKLPSSESYSVLVISATIYTG